MTKIPQAYDDFTVREYHTAPDPSAVDAILSGQVPAVLVRDAMSTTDGRALYDAFVASPARRSRGDDVSGTVLGAYHYGKTAQDYLAEVAATAPAVEEFLLAGHDPVDRVLGWFREVEAGHGRRLRRATWGDQPAGLARGSLWTASGRYVLDIHEDVGQLQDPQQAGFEIQACAAGGLVAINLYPNVPARGGELRIWNARPDDATRASYGVEGRGFPYPEHVTEGIEHLDVAVRSGDCLLVDGSLLHAVGGYDVAEGDLGRLLINLFVGRLDDQESVHWV